MIIVKCPTCHIQVEWSASQMFKPFCSERCKFVDLGEWFMEEKRIAGESMGIEIPTKLDHLSE